MATQRASKRPGVIRLLPILLALGVGFSMSGCGSGGLAQPAPSYGPRGGGDWMAGGGG